MTADAIRNLQSSLDTDLTAFLPEVVLCATIVILLLIRLFPRFDRRHLGSVALIFTLYALYVSWAQWTGSRTYDPRAPGESFAGYKTLPGFGGMLVYDNFLIFVRLFLYGFTALVIWLSLLTGIPDTEDSADFYVLLLGAVVGMAMMAAANHLMMVFIGIEMASLPSYALAGFLKGRRQSSEASLKYVVYGGGAAGIMLYGISLIAGKFGTGYLPDVAEGFRVAQFDPLLILASLFVLIGIAFKLAAVPFHFWCPDVFEGASAEVAGFLSVASKGAALALLARIVLAVAGPTEEDWLRVAPYLAPALAIFAAVTATFGNLAAYAQNNLKRLLAYSTIAHAGYMMMGLATLTADGVGAVLFYLVAYLFMNLGAFAVVAFLRNLTGSEDLRDFRGLINRAPVLVVTLAVFLLSLLGIPPLAGFAAKFQVFSVLYDSGQFYQVRDQEGLAYTMYALLVIGGLNTVISTLYYVKVLRVMILEKPLEEVEGRPSEPLEVPSPVAGYAVVLAAVLFVIGILWGPLDNASRIKGVEGLVPTGAPRLQAQAR
ncbi:MAG: NADH-quinone oxidoreductase subunit N [Gemmataceae bacterium]|nr:NADH-quinone oxidoreductase subunit N [Gemmataceae bacterium]